MLKYWNKSNQRYFGNLAINLEGSLNNNEAIYEYGWNYPIARFLALRISKKFLERLGVACFQWRLLYKAGLE